MSSLRLAPGIRVEMTGEYVSNESWGDQFRFSSVKILGLTNTREGIIAWLRMLGGIGEATARRIYAKFGAQTRDIILEHAEQLSVIPGMGPARINSIAERAAELQATLELGDSIQPLIDKGVLTDKSVNRIYKTHGKNSINIIRESPYQLANIPEIGFRSADRMARESTDYKPDSEARIYNAATSVISNLSKGGHTCAPVDEVVKWTNLLLASADSEYGDDAGEYQGAIESSLHKIGRDGLCVFYEDHIYDYRMWDVETSVINKLSKLRSPTSVTYSQALEMVRESGVTLDDHQAKTAASALTSPFSCIKGHPGTGKTSLVEAICRVSERLGWNITLCAPTGKASKVLNEKTGTPAFTIHRILEATPDGKFGRNCTNPLPSGLIVVDEGTQTDLPLLEKLLDSIPSAARSGDSALLMVGDPNQLHPVGPGCPFVDIVDSGVYPVSTLSKIYRTEEGSSIAEACASIRNGQVPNWPNDGEMDFSQILNLSSLAQTLVQRLVHMVVDEGIPMDEIQVIVPHKIGVAGAPVISWMYQQAMGFTGKSVIIGKREVPNQLKDVMPEDARVFKGDRVRHTVNNKDLKVFNGEVGTVVEALPHINTVVVEYPDRKDHIEYRGPVLRELTLSTASTCHSIQGSQALNVLVGIHQSKLLDRRLIYTAISRARTYCNVYGSEAAVAAAVHNLNATVKYSKMMQRLRRHK